MICPNCNREIPDGSKFCGYCGNKIEIAPNNASELTETNIEVTQAVSEVVEQAAASVEAPQPVPEAAEQAAASVEAPQPVPEAAEQAAPSVEAPQPVPEAAEQAAPSVEAPQPVSEAAEQAAASVEVPQPVPEAAEQTAASVEAPQSVSEAVEQTAASVEAPQPVSEAVGQAAASVGVPQPVSNNASFASNSYTAPSGGAAFQGVQPGMANNAADLAAQPGVQEGISGKRAFNIASLLKNKLFLICAGALLLVIILIVIIANAAGSASSKGGRKGSYYFAVSDGEGVVLYNSNVVKGTDLSRHVNKLGESNDGTKILYEDEDDSELFLFDNGKAYFITDELYNSQAKLSNSGAVVYISDGSLYVYSGAGGKSKEIAELDNPDYCNYAISPDGKTVVFSEYKYDDDVWRNNKKYSYLNAWDGNKIIDLDDKFAPFYVSNGGKLICGVDVNNKFTFMKSMKPGTAEKFKTITRLYPVSADHSKIMYVSDGSTYYFDASVSEPIKVYSKEFTILTPINDSSFPKNLNTFYAVSNGGIYRFVKKKDSYDSEKIVSSVSNVILSADGKAIVYRHNDEIIKISVSNPDKELTIAEDVSTFSAFRCDPSLNHIYYFDEDGELRYASKNNKKIGSDVISFSVNDKGLCVYLTDDGVLYYSSKGGDKTKITGISDVTSIRLIDNIFYASTDEAIYISTDGKSFKKSIDL